MGIIEQILLILGLSMDGFCASICMGMTAGRRRLSSIVLLISGFHVTMLLTGMALGAALPDALQAAFPWAAGFLLCFMGVNMVRKASDPEASAADLSIASTAELTLATSLDAATVGVAFALMDVAPIRAAALTAVIMGTLSVTGATVGACVDHRRRCAARQVGGVILSFLGLRLLLTAAGVI